MGRWALLAAIAVTGTGCGLESLCPAEYTFGDRCVGVPGGPVCGGSDCARGVECAATIEVADAGALAEAASGAAAGTCLVLADGTYPAVTLPAGVSLLGRGAESVTVEGVAITGGGSAVLRGLSITKGGVTLDGEGHTRLESVRVDGAQGSGVALSNGASATLVTSTIIGAGGYGIDALGAASLDVSDTVIEGAGGPGIWAECAAGCDCADKPQVFLTRTVVHGASLVGVALHGAEAALTDVRILETAQVNFNAGGGLSIAACADVSATGLTVSNNADFGVLIDASSASLGQLGDGAGIVVTGNLRGIWAQGISGPEPQSVHIENAAVEANRGIGVGVGGETVGFIICRSKISGTLLHSLPVGLGASDAVGDGLLWTEGSAAVLEQVEVSDSARASVLIDGAVGAGSALIDVTFSAGDAQKSVLQQEVPPGGAVPATQGSVPPIEAPDSPYSVALPPTSPAPP